MSGHDERLVSLTHLEIACALAAVNAVADSAPHGVPPVFATTREKLSRALASRDSRPEEGTDG